MEEHIVIVDEGQGNDLDRLKNVSDTNESIQVLADSFTAVAEKMKGLADALRDESIDVYDPVADKRQREQSFKNGVSNLKHIKKRGGR